MFEFVCSTLEPFPRRGWPRGARDKGISSKIDLIRVKLIWCVWHELIFIRQQIIDSHREPCISSINFIMIKYYELMGHRVKQPSKVESTQLVGHFIRYSPGTLRSNSEGGRHCRWEEERETPKVI